MLYIQICSKVWNDPAYRQLRVNLQQTLPEYQFLGICAVMWRFLNAAGRRRWANAAGVPVAQLKTEVVALAMNTIKIIRRK